MAVVVQALYNRRCSRSSKPYAAVFGVILLPRGKGLKGQSVVPTHGQYSMYLNNRLLLIDKGI